ncbi:MAG TPA: hypothetical protein PKA64_21350 [Myxococcota bacterium]|nr:hypothetical protein [Myxococcota bacterium]
MSDSPIPSLPAVERAAATLVFAGLGGFAVWFDALSLHRALADGMVPAARGVAAIALGWMFGWYLTTRFEPTHRFLVQAVLALAGYVVAAIACAVSFSALALIDLLGADPTRSPFLAMTAVTFAPVSSYFATRLDPGRSVHLVAGMGIGVCTYLVLLGVPD